MRSALFGKSDYFMRIKRKPAQEDLYQKVIRNELSDEEIENCGQPLWIREALREIKTRGGLTQWQCVDKVIEEAEAAQARAANQTYPVYEWTAPMMEVTPEKGMSLEVFPGNLMLVDRPRGQVKIDYSLLTLSPAKIDALLGNAKYICDSTDTGFVELVGSRKQRI